MEQGSSKHTANMDRTYILTWLALTVLACVSIAVTNINIGIAGILVALVIASVKAVLILFFFMHLEYESRFFKLAFLLPIMVLLFSIGFTFLDVLYR